MASYKPQVLHKFADKMYAIATMLIITGALGGAVFGLFLGGAVLMMILGEDQDSLAMVLGALIGAVCGGVSGYLAGFWYKFAAQMVLCLLQVETNTRRRSPRPVFAPAGPAQFVGHPVVASPPPAIHDPSGLSFAEDAPELAVAPAGVTPRPDPEPVAPPPPTPAPAPTAPDELVDKRIKFRCKACQRKFGGTVREVALLHKCPRCGATPFESVPVD